MIYFDGCYMAKYYLAEPDSRQVIAAALSAGVVASCLHGQLEVTSVFHRKWREKQLAAPEFALLAGQFDDDCRDGLWEWLPITDDLVHEARKRFSGLPATMFLRASDALHLTCASEHGFTEIYSNDRHLLAAAPHFGLTGVTL